MKRPRLRNAIVSLVVLVGIFMLVSYTLTAVTLVTFAGLVLLSVGMLTTALGAAMGKVSWGAMIISVVTTSLLFAFLLKVVLPSLRTRPATVSIAVPPAFPEISRVQDYELRLVRVPRRGFVVQHRILASTPRGLNTLQIQGDTIRSANAGLFVRRVVIELPCGSVTGPSASRARLARNSGVLPCPDSIGVKLVDMPTDMFYQARGVSSVQRTPFVGTESIEWSIPGDQQSIAFAYLVSPAHIVKPFFPEFVWAHSGGRMIIIGVCVLTSMIILPISISVASEFVKKFAGPKEPPATA
jgi:hypothetical protein